MTRRLTLHYPWRQPDIQAGLRCSAYIVPIAASVAVLAGLNLQSAIFAAAAGFVVFAFAGSSRTGCFTAAVAVAALLADGLTRGGIGGDEAAAAAVATITFTTALALLAVGRLDLAFLGNVVSRPAYIGLRAGIGVWILGRLAGTLVGIPATSASFFTNIGDLVSRAGSIDVLTALLSATCVALVIGARRAMSRLPWALLPIGAGLIATLAGLDNHGIALVAQVPEGLPHVALPAFGHPHALWPAVLCVPLFALIEASVLRRRSAGDGAWGHEASDGIALGVANAISGLFGGMPAAPDPEQTELAAEAGAQSRNSRLTIAGLLLATGLLLGTLLSQIPQASLAVIVMAVALEFVDVETFRALYRGSRLDLGLAVAAAAGVLAFAPLSGVLVAVGLSLAVLLYEMNRPSVGLATRSSNRHNGTGPEAAPDNVLAVKIEGPVYFANVDRVAAAVLKLVEAQDPPPEDVVLDAVAVNDIDDEALKEVGQLSRHLNSRSMQLWLAGLNGSARVRVQSQAAETLAGVRIVASAADATRAAHRAHDRQRRSVA